MLANREQDRNRGRQGRRGREERWEKEKQKIKGSKYRRTGNVREDSELLCFLELKQINIISSLLFPVVQRQWSVERDLSRSNSRTLHMCVRLCVDVFEWVSCTVPVHLYYCMYGSLHMPAKAHTL